GHPERPGLEVGAGTELGAVAPQDDVRLLQDVVGRVGGAEEREDVREEPALMLGHQAHELVRSAGPLHAINLQEKNNGWRADLTPDPDLPPEGGGVPRAPGEAPTPP